MFDGLRMVLFYCLFVIAEYKNNQQQKDDGIGAPSRQTLVHNFEKHDGHPNGKQDDHTDEEGDAIDEILEGEGRSVERLADARAYAPRGAHWSLVHVRGSGDDEGEEKEKDKKGRAHADVDSLKSDALYFTARPKCTRARRPRAAQPS